MYRLFIQLAIKCWCSRKAILLLSTGRKQSFDAGQAIGKLHKVPPKSVHFQVHPLGYKYVIQYYIRIKILWNKFLLKGPTAGREWILCRGEYFYNCTYCTSTQTHIFVLCKTFSFYSPARAVVFKPGFLPVLANSCRSCDWICTDSRYCWLTLIDHGENVTMRDNNSLQSL